MSNDTPDEYYDFVNTAYWKTCSLLLEETVRKGFIAVSRIFSVTNDSPLLSYSSKAPSVGRAPIYKVGCVYPMFILSEFHKGQNRTMTIGKTHPTLQSQ